MIVPEPSAVKPEGARLSVHAGQDARRGGQQPYGTTAAGHRLGMTRSGFVRLARVFNLDYTERRGVHGGSPTKYYSRESIDLLAAFVHSCNERGGEAVLRDWAQGMGKS